MRPPYKMLPLGAWGRIISFNILTEKYGASIILCVSNYSWEPCHGRSYWAHRSDHGATTIFERHPTYHICLQRSPYIFVQSHCIVSIEFWNGSRCHFSNPGYDGLQEKFRVYNDKTQTYAIEPYFLSFLNSLTRIGFTFGLVTGSSSVVDGASHVLVYHVHLGQNCCNYTSHMKPMPRFMNW